jgi:Ca2+-binding EF-hand superfamily protein
MPTKEDDAIEMPELRESSILGRLNMYSKSELERSTSSENKNSKRKIQKTSTLHSLTSGLNDAFQPMSPFQKLRREIRTGMEFPNSSIGALLYSSLSGILIVINAGATIQSTLNNNGYIQPYNWKPATFDTFSFLFFIFFSIDLFTRFLCADTYFRRYSLNQQVHLSYSIKTKQVCTPFFIDYFTWFDLLSVISLPIGTMHRMAYPYHPRLQIIDLLSVFRLARIFTATRHLHVTKIMAKTTYNSIGGIYMLLVMLLCFVSIIALGLLYLEPCLDKKDCQFENGITAIYFSFITITTVGYGDFTPTKTFGKVLAIVTMIAGATYMAMPLAIVGASFEDVYEEHTKNYLLDTKKRLRAHRVTRKERIIRAMKMKDLVIKELFFLHQYTKNAKTLKTKQRQFLRGISAIEYDNCDDISASGLQTTEKKTKITTIEYDNCDDISASGLQTTEKKTKITTKRRLERSKRMEEKAKHRLLLSELCKDAGQLVVDINVLFQLKNEYLQKSAIAHKDRRKEQEESGGDEIKQRRFPRTLPVHYTTRLSIEAMQEAKKMRKEANIHHQMQELLAQGHDEVVRLHTMHEKECKQIRTAIKRNECHDRVYLCVKVRQSSACALTYYKMNHTMVFFNLLAMFIETMHVMQVYGPATPACKRVVQYHCMNIIDKYCDGKNIATINDSPPCIAARKYNSGCFRNTSINYNGCLESDLSLCDFPKGNMTCKPQFINNASSAYSNAPFDEKWILNSNKNCGFGYPTKALCNNAEDCTWNDYLSSCIEKGSTHNGKGKTYVSKVAINICSRVQCQKNQNFGRAFVKHFQLENEYYFYEFFWWIEFIFMVWFLLDLVLNIVVRHNVHESGYFFWWEKRTIETTDDENMKTIRKKSRFSTYLDEKKYNASDEDDEMSGNNLDDDKRASIVLLTLNDQLTTANMSTKDLFDTMNISGDNEVSPDELLLGIEKCGFKPSKNEFKRLIELLDKDRDGKVAYDEFNSAIEKVVANETKKDRSIRLSNSKQKKKFLTKTIHTFHYDFNNIIFFLTTVAQFIEVMYCTFYLYGKPTMKYTIYGNIWR